MTPVLYCLDKLEDYKLEYGHEAQAELAAIYLEDCVDGQIDFASPYPSEDDITPTRFVRLCQRIIDKANGVQS